jgi:uncharacterized protein (DUF983 family)
MTETDPTHAPTPGDCLGRGLRRRCPRCGQGSLFQGFLNVVPACGVCGLDFSGHDAGDATAVPALLIVGGVLVGVLLWMEFTYEPPVWVHLAVLAPLGVGLTLAILPPLKGAAIGLQHAFRSTSETTRPGGS